MSGKYSAEAWQAAVDAAVARIGYGQSPGVRTEAQRGPDGIVTVNVPVGAVVRWSRDKNGSPHAELVLPGQ